MLLSLLLPSYTCYSSSFSSSSFVKSSELVLNVEDFGANGDGRDDSEAFIKAWKKACSLKDSILLVPDKTYVLKPAIFSGPCQSNLTFRIQGTIEASSNISDYKNRNWIRVENVRNLKVDGYGTINGNGQVWWPKSCKVNKTLPCVGAPTAVTFYKCINLRMKDMRIKNAQQIHLTFQKCKNIDASNLIITSPEKSPNTDGIHITSSQNIHIRNSIISTGDDCISIVSGSKVIRTKNIMCGPGHGISIGSLGENHARDTVSDVLVNGATFDGTTNGVRIKSWQGGRGYAKNIVFKNILMRNVSNPIIIDQNYCDQIIKNCTKQKEAVQIKNIVYKNIKGTSASEVALKFDCSESIPCANIVMENIHLYRESDDNIEAKCVNANLVTRGNVFPKCKKDDVAPAPSPS